MGEGDMIMLAKAGGEKTFENKVTTAFKDIAAKGMKESATRQLSRLIAVLKGVQSVKLQDPQCLLSVKADDGIIDITFIDAHTVGASTSAVQVDNLIRIFEKFAKENA